jgi:hypothetical protein
MLGSSLIAAQLAASQEGLSSMKLGGVKFQEMYEQNIGV